MKFRCEPVELAYLERASHRFINTVELEASAEAVFEIFTDGPAWVSWFPEILEVTWTSPQPFGVGTTRTVRLTDMTVHERFLAWEPGRRLAFCFVAMSAPIARSFLEDYRLEEISVDRCRLIWTVCYEPRLLLKLTHPIMRSRLDRMFRQAAAGLAAYVRERGGSS